MAISNLSQVTRTVIELLRQAFIVSTAWPEEAPEILPEPPSRITEQGLGFYLYHVEENAAYKNLPAPGGNLPPVRFTPLALTLYYQLSANSMITDETEGAYEEQTMMGIAMKALHDNPEITDDTFVNNVQIMNSFIREQNNRFKISLQPVPYNEAIQFWTAGTAPLKLSAYYEISVVLFEPETIQARTGRVLEYGVHTFAMGAPQLTGSQNILSFLIPDTTKTRQVKIQPAQAPPNDLPNSRITFWGTGFRGDFVELLLLGHWESWNHELARADASWNVSGSDNTLTAEVQETALLESDDAVTVLPGIYGVQVRVVRNRVMPGGYTRQFVHLSNQCPITITPRVDAIDPPNGTIFFTVTGFGWRHADLDASLVQVYIGPEQLEAGDPNNLNPGEFGIVDNTTLRFIPPGTLNTNETFPLRIFVNGTESPPRWITIPE